MTVFATARDTPVEGDAQLKTARVGQGRRGWLCEAGEQECLVPFQAHANKPHQPLTSLPEKQAGNVMSCHYSLQGQPMGLDVSTGTNQPVGAA